MFAPEGKCDTTEADAVTVHEELGFVDGIDLVHA